MITPVLADMFVKSVTSTSQMSEAGKTNSDSAFQKIFDSTLNSTDSNSQENDFASSTSSADKEPEVVACKYECQTGDTGSVKSESPTNQADDKSTESADAATQVEEEPSAKVEKLKKEDPKSYDSLIANLDNMTIGDLLTALGIDTQSANVLNSGLNLDSPIPEELKLALLSGDSPAINDVFASLGLGQTAVASSLSGLGNNTQAGMATTTESLTSAASQATSQDGAVTTTTTNSPTAKISDAGDSTASSGSQSSMSDNASLGSNSNNSSMTSSTTTPNTQTSASNTAPTVDPSAASTTAQAQTAASVQADAKPVITVQNLTNETATNAINSQAAKTGEAQAQSNARPADTVRQTSDRAILEQVIEKARVIVRPNGSSNMVIRLDPPSLGKIDMRIDVKDGSVRAAIVTENKEVKSAIEGNIESLKNTLNANGLKVDEISVSVGGDQGFKFKNDGMAQQTGDQSFGDRKRAAGQFANDSETAADDTLARRSAAYRHNGVLDVVA